MAGRLTFDGGAVGIGRLLQARHGEHRLDADHRVLVAHPFEHAVVDGVVDVLVDRRRLRHAAEQTVQQLAAAQADGAVGGGVVLRRKGLMRRRRRNAGVNDAVSMTTQWINDVTMQ